MQSHLSSTFIDEDDWIEQYNFFLFSFFPPCHNIPSLSPYPNQVQVHPYPHPHLTTKPSYHQFNFNRGGETCAPRKRKKYRLVK